MKISIVIPTYGSVENLPFLLERIEQVALSQNLNYELILVDDNSPDNTLKYLKEVVVSKPKVKVLSLSRNFGQQVAISAGLKYTTGDAVIIMDDDLQDPPEFIPDLIHKWKEGYDIVYAIKVNRKEHFLKNFGYKMFYRVISQLSEINIPQDSGDFCIMSSQVVSILNSMSERDRFLRGMRAWVGYKQIGIPCDRAKRLSGKPAYTFSKMIKLSLDGIFSFSNAPLRLMSYTGFIIFFCAAIGILATLFQKIISVIHLECRISEWSGFSPILLSVLFIGGLQLIGIGIIGEYIGRIFSEVKQRPMFLIKETIGFDTIKEPLHRNSNNNSPN